MSNQNPKKMIVVELNEAERYFLKKYSEEGLLPTFNLFLNQGLFIETRIADWESNKEKAWRDISPWIVWPSVYTGLKPNQHKLIGFGQDTQILQGRCIWDRLNDQNITTGVCGNLMSFPVRQNPYSLFYIPEALASTSECVPKQLEPLQDFFVFTARNYSENFLSMAAQSLLKLVKAIPCGVKPKRLIEILSQIPLELILGKHQHRKRALLQAKLQIDLFLQLYQNYQPQFATVHLNQIAYMQHRYWRAAEPQFFSEDLGPLDRHFYGDLSKRQKYEGKFQNAILEGFQLADRFLETLVKQMDENTVIVVMTGLGQQRMDPTKDIHNPEMRFLNLEQLFRFFDIPECDILTQMNPDITLNFKSSTEALHASEKLSQISVQGHPLFHIQPIGNQLFLEGNLHPSIWESGKNTFIRSSKSKEQLPLFDFIRVSAIKDQSTAHHRDNGWILCYGNTKPLSLNSFAGRSIDITEISDHLLQYFN